MGLRLAVLKDSGGVAGTTSGDPIMFSSEEFDRRMGEAVERVLVHEMAKKSSVFSRTFKYTQTEVLEAVKKAFAIVAGDLKQETVKEG